MPSRSVQVISKAFEATKQKLLAKRDEAQLPDDSFLDLYDISAFFKFPSTCSTLHPFTSVAGENKPELIKLHPIYTTSNIDA